jgi:tartrate dehydratase alpha subunit/fumarate hydratase class I-like protein
MEKGSSRPTRMIMRDIHVDEISSVIEQLFIDANYDLPEDVVKRFNEALTRKNLLWAKKCSRSFLSTRG